MSDQYKNEIVYVNGQYVVVNGNAESAERYDTYEDALVDSLADEAAYAPAVPQEEAQEISPITWV